MSNQANGIGKVLGTSPMNVIAVTSGKGGVGKTNVSVNIAVGLAAIGKTVVVFDADLGLANVDVALGLKPKYDIRHVISGERTLEEILLEGPNGIYIVPASSGVSDMAKLSVQEQVGLIRAFSELTFGVDALIVDTAAGIDPAVLSFTSACQEIIVVICDEPTSITDGYALIKVLNREAGVKRFHVLANMMDNESHGLQLFSKVSRVTDQFLDISLNFLGSIPRDEYLRKAVQAQKPVLLSYPGSPSAKAFIKLVNRIDTRFSRQVENGGLGFFIERLLQTEPAEII